MAHTNQFPSGPSYSDSKYHKNPFFVCVNNFLSWRQIIEENDRKPYLNGNIFKNVFTTKRALNAIPSVSTPVSIHEELKGKSNDYVYITIIISLGVFFGVSYRIKICGLFNKISEIENAHDSKL